EDFEHLFRGPLTCRLVLFRYADMTKDPTKVQELASVPFVPEFSDVAAPRSYTLTRFLGSTVPGANFPIGNGLGVAVVVEKTSPGVLRLSEPGQAFLRVHGVTLE